MRVDLPAPFSPARACTSPGNSSRETSRRARTAPKDFETSFSASTGAGPVSDGWVMGAPRRRRRDGPHRVVKGFNWIAGTLGMAAMSRQWVRVEKISIAKGHGGVTEDWVHRRA